MMSVRAFSLAAALFLAAVSTTASAQGAKLKAGPLVYVVSQVPARVELDGQTVGDAPILLNLSGLKQAQVLISTDSGEDGFTLEVDPSQGAIAYYRPVFRPFTGFLAVRGAAPASTISVDGAKAVPLGAEPLRLRTGTHSFRIDCPGKASIVDAMRIEKRAMAAYQAKQVPGFALALSPPPPALSRVSALGPGGSVIASFAYGEGFLLPGGPASFSLSVPGFPKEFAFMAAPAKGAVPSPLGSGAGSVSVGDLPAGARVLVDGKPASVEGGKIVLDAGLRRIDIEANGRIVISESVYVQAGRAIELPRR